MRLIRGIQKTAAVSAIALLAFSAAQSMAAEDVSDLGHISASVTGLLEVSERAAIKFGNFSITCGGGTCANSSSITLSETGTRTAVSAGGDTITLLYGAGGADAGIANGTDQETGSQAPGFYDIVTGEGTHNVYVSFADENGNIIDSNHPDNFATLSHATAVETFTVDSFTFDSDDGTTGYSGGNSTADIYGSYINCAGTCAVRVGATLHTTVTAADYTPGQYAGTFYIMVSY